MVPKDIVAEIASFAGENDVAAFDPSVLRKHDLIRGLPFFCRRRSPPCVVGALARSGVAVNYSLARVLASQNPRTSSDLEFLRETLRSTADEYAVLVLARRVAVLCLDQGSGRGLKELRERSGKAVDSEVLCRIASGDFASANLALSSLGETRKRYYDLWQDVCQFDVDLDDPPPNDVEGLWYICIDMRERLGPFPSCMELLSEQALDWLSAEG